MIKKSLCGGFFNVIFRKRDLQIFIEKKKFIKKNINGREAN